MLIEDLLTSKTKQLQVLLSFTLQQFDRLS